MAILGRQTLYYGELRRMAIAENIYTAYQMRKKSKEWDKLTQEHSVLMGLLFEAEKLAQGDE